MTRGVENKDYPKNPTGSARDDLFERLVTVADVGLYEVSVDGHFQYANPALIRLFGCETLEELQSSFSSADSCYVDPIRRAFFISTLQRDQEIHGFISEVNCAHGRTFFVSENASVQCDPQGTVVAYVGAITEITEIRETQERLEAAEESYRRIFERSPVGIYRSSLDGKQLRANPTLVRLNGYETEAEQISGVEDIATEWYVVPARRDEFARQLEEHGIVRQFESEIYRHKTRERIWISEDAYVVRSPTGDPLFYEGMVSEITERKKAEAELRFAIEEAQSADRAKSRFLANMSHELRTPLNSIIGFTEFILTEPHGPLGSENYAAYLSDVQKSGALLLNLINEILDIAKLDAGKVTLDREPVDIAVLVHDSQQMLARRRKDADVSLEQDIPENLPTVIGDERRLRQVILNLLSNALRYTKPGGKAHISARQDGDEVVIVVTDTGVGIPAEDLERIFEPFERSTYAIQEAAEGMGLGLPLARELVTHHGGTIVLESEVGVGTTVTVRLPLDGPQIDL